MAKSTSRGGKPNRPGQSLITFALLVVIVGGLGLLFWPKKTSPAAPPANPTNISEVIANAGFTGAPDIGAVSGNWLREDGGYQLKLVRDGERLVATYLNPRPINVSFTSITNDAGTLKLRVELQDVNYPGCVYSLVYDRSNDRLLGTYFQAAMNQTFEVVFTRMSDPTAR